MAMVEDSGKWRECKHEHCKLFTKNHCQVCDACLDYRYEYREHRPTSRRGMLERLGEDERYNRELVEDRGVG